MLGERCRRVYYGALADLITSLEEAKAAGRLGHRLNTLTYPALLVVDERFSLRSTLGLLGAAGVGVVIGRAVP